MLLEQRDVLQAVAKWLTRAEAGKLLATLCKACAVLVQAADAAEEAGVPEFWLPMPPMWEMNHQMPAGPPALEPGRRAFAGCATQAVLHGRGPSARGARMSPPRRRVGRW